MRFSVIALLATLAGAGQAGQPDVFKLGRFAQGGRTFLGVVVDDKSVAEIPSSAGDNLKAIIRDYAKHRPTLRDLAAKARSGKDAGIHDLKSLDTLAPIADPLSVLNAAVNYVEHGNEMARAGGSGAAAPARSAPPPGQPALQSRRCRARQATCAALPSARRRGGRRRRRMP